MGRGKYEAKRTYPSRRNNPDEPRPGTPPWLRKTVIGRHRSKFVIGGGIVLTSFLTLSITAGIIVFNGLKKEQENIDVEVTTKREHLADVTTTEQGNVSAPTPTSKQEEFSTEDPAIECASFPEIVRERNSSEIILKSVFRERLRGIFEKDVPEDENGTVKEIKSFYKFCMDEDSIGRYGEDSLKYVIMRMTGWPIKSFVDGGGSCLTKSFCLQPKEGKNLGQHSISAWVVPCPSNETYCIKLSSDLLMGSMKQCDLLWHALVLWRKLGCLENSNLREQIWRYKPCLMENFVERVSEPEFQVRQNMSMTIDEYERKKEYGGALIRDSIPEGVGITNRTVVYLQYPEAIKKSLSHTLESDSNLRTSLAIAMFRLVASFKFFLPKTLHNYLPKLVFLETLEHLEDETRWEGCVDEIISAYPSTSMTMYRREYYDSESEEKVKGIFNDVKEGFSHIFAKINWVDNQTKDRLSAVSLYTPKPQKDIPGKLTIDRRYPIQTVLNLKHLKVLRNFSYLNESFDLGDEEFANIDKNDPSPHYMARLNRLYIPVETVHMYFEKGRPDYVNYVTLGFIIARQIALGFHHQWFGGNGNATIVNCFNQLFLNRFTNHPEDKSKEKDSKEIVANYMGIRAAYAAYDISIKRTGNPQSNDDTHNNHRMFWITAGTLFSSNDSIELELIPHLDEFHRDYYCQIGTRMYPKKTCSLD